MQVRDVAVADSKNDFFNQSFSVETEMQETFLTLIVCVIDRKQMQINYEIIKSMNFHFMFHQIAEFSSSFHIWRKM
jgi:hypothetical protein